MEKIERRLYYIELIHHYGDLLSSTQKEILTDHLEFDLSISEIADSRSVSRAAVEDAIKKGIRKLEEYEEALSLYKKKIVLLSKIEKLKEKVGNCREIEEIEEEIA